MYSFQISNPDSLQCVLTCALVCNPLQRNMATAGETVESQAEQEMEAEEQIDFLGMLEKCGL